MALLALEVIPNGQGQEDKNNNDKHFPSFTSSRFPSHCALCTFAAGYYTHVSTLADVQENVMEYLHVLSRPMVINHDHDIIWTEAYMDSVVSFIYCLINTSHSLWVSVVIILHFISGEWIIEPKKGQINWCFYEVNNNNFFSQVNNVQ